MPDRKGHNDFCSLACVLAWVQARLKFEQVLGKVGDAEPIEEDRLDDKQAEEG
jgi:hypothetical protein